ncbi:MAG: hypothetical protein IKQ46_13170 [Bacteroidales bacterium]|nr:hypothetical protein [Bacteroidales bacterium]
MRILSLIKTVIFITVFFYSLCVSAQEYNNWLLSGSILLDFNFSPAKLSCTGLNNLLGFCTTPSVALSDKNGKLLIYGCFVPIEDGKYSFCIFDSKSLDKPILFYGAGVLKNVIGCKIPDGGYYVAFVWGSIIKNELHVLKFNESGIFEKEFIYNQGYYSAFLDVLFVDNDVVFLTYKQYNKHYQIETYKLSSKSCSLVNVSEVFMQGVLLKYEIYFSIVNSLDNTTIVLRFPDFFYVLKYDMDTYEVSVVKRIELNSFNPIAFSEKDKYFMIIDEGKLKGYKYYSDYDFSFTNPDFIYDISSGGKFSIALGLDGQLYVYKQNWDYIMILDGIESGNITKNIVKMDCLSNLFCFPFIPRYKSCRAQATFNNSIVCFDDEGLKVNLSGTAPYEVFYTLDGEEKSFKTSAKEFILPNIVGKYKIEKVKDATCEFLPVIDNEAVVYDKLKKIKIIAE